MKATPALIVPRKWSASIISIVCGASIAEENSCGFRKNDQARALVARKGNVPSKCTSLLLPGLRSALLAEASPHRPRRDRDRAARHAEMSQGIHDRIDD